MHPIIYDVAVSLDGFIAGPLGDVSQFTYQGPVVDDYIERMSHYKTAIMGRVTYEFGYQFGLEAGQNPYGNMKTLVFSKTLQLPTGAEVEVVRTETEKTLADLKSRSDGPIYLCGGGAFAGSLLKMGLIDQLCLKRTPIVLGRGIELFGNVSLGVSSLSRANVKLYDSGHILEEFVT